MAHSRHSLDKVGPCATADRCASGGAVAKGPSATGGGAGERVDWGEGVTAEVVDGSDFGCRKLLVVEPDLIHLALEAVPVV